MRAIQSRILKLILEKVEVPEYIHAFEKDKSIPIMAAMHTGKRVVISLDLKDYFGSIKQHHLQEMFANLGFSETPAITLSELCTFKSYVPQGALTSPKISNIITMLTFGPAVKEFCERNNLTISIFADDITISSTVKLTGENETVTVKNVIDSVSAIVQQYGFRLNREKIKVMNNYQRQYVCGAVVNEKVNMQKTERNKLRAIVYNCQRNGVEIEAAKNNIPAAEFTSRIMGHLNWFAQLNPVAGNIIKSKFKEVVAEQTCQPNANEVVPEVIPTVVVANTISEESPWVI